MMENERLKMGLAATNSTNPYVAILIDGDGLNVRCVCQASQALLIPRLVLSSLC
jgi:hypothetical protein